VVFNYKQALIQFFQGSRALEGLGLIIFEVSRSRPDTLFSVGLVRTSNQPVAQTFTWQQTIITNDINSPGGIRTRNPRKRTIADPRLRQWQPLESAECYEYNNVVLCFASHKLQQIDNRLKYWQHWSDERSAK